jgi:NAD(P)-dependent dehydrogenase (short-subunit alcohol dehydrogenase family)
VATARDPKTLADVIAGREDRAIAVALDVADEVASRAAVASAVKRFGRLDVAVNNAGYANISSIEDTSSEDFRAQIETNLFGTVNVSRAAIPVMREQRSGHIIQFSSVGGRVGSPGLGAYQTAKFAVEGFSEVLSKEVAPFGVKVTIIEPGGFRTDWAGSSMKVPDIRSEYDTTVGEMARRIRASSGHQPGDPARAAQIVLRIVGESNPPLRLLLGQSAVKIAKETDDERAESDAKWRSLSLSADFGAEEV